jgi:phosphoglycolate phosphatase-like HAD superfamily hydrolase
MNSQPSSAGTDRQTGHVTTTSDDPLPSWNEGAAKAAIVRFVRATTDPASPDYVRPEKRIATFDNDGTLWAEQPYYFQFAFAIDQIKALAPRFPEWQDREPFKSILTGDAKSVLNGDQRALVQIVAVTHFGTTTDEFEAEVQKWLASARHPHTDRPYTDMVFQPMVEVLGYLRANDFKTFIVSGGGIEFMRTFAEQTYGIPHQQVIGSSGKLKFEMRDGKPVLLKLAEINFIDDHAGKPVGIQHHIGRRPIAAFGNSDGDLQMLQWTTHGEGARFALLVRHTDAIREWEYDRHSDVGRLDKALDEANEKGWTVVDMKIDWRRVFPFEQ